ncbi:hypothetical protein LSH36_189g03057 [Paralvinella palmiformis]|uniref:Uncharacterized protein n=1 Tax=Paralvinella palmiformis TaxID=53620 RepID=A0AAD9JSQ7_9ANNE|nr:hypothetical protein LSH36_189g03057 [Paralvinella palmiformis]
MQLKTFTTLHIAEPADIEATLNHLWFFFEVVSKTESSCVLDNFSVLQMPRDERFPSSFLETVQTLLTNITALILQTYRERPHEMKNANISLAHFIKRCFTFMDRGFVFRLINSYIEMYSPGDPKILQNFKFDFLSVICSHEHYIPLNLPLMRKQVKNYKGMAQKDSSILD